MIPLSLFDNSLDYDEKSHIAATIVSSEMNDSFQNRTGTGFGKPVFPASISSSSNLKDLVGSNSWKFFELLKNDPEFMSHSPETWHTLESYVNAERIINSFKVCNDSAERGVKLSADFHGSAKSESNYQKILQVVENDRKQKPDQKSGKRPNPDMWFLHL